MEKLSIETWTKEIVKFFEQKMSVAEAKKVIATNVKKDMYNNDVRCSNVRVFYTENKNYCGARVGTGRGFYITDGKNTVKV